MTVTANIGMEETKLSRRVLTALFTDTKKSAEAVNLIYVTDKQPGIIRRKIGEGYRYLLKGKAVKDQNILLRIKRLVIPPAWEQVWISPEDNGHLQVTGLDTKNRKQYIYHPFWNVLRNQTKFGHMFEFGKALPAIRAQLQKDLQRQGLPKQKVLAAIVGIMEHTCIRIGSSLYEQLYGSYGLTTMKNKHVTVSGATIKFSFKGKKSVLHDIKMENRKLANIVSQCIAIPGKDVFQYYDENGKKRRIDSGMVNNYIKQISGGCFTAKDFRTWSGTLHALEAFRQLGPATTQNAIKKNIVTALDMVAERLGNTRTVCKKYYVHPLVIDHYTNNTLEKYLSKRSRSQECNDVQLNESEQLMMKLLKSS